MSIYIEIFPGYLFFTFFCAFRQEVEPGLIKLEPQTKVEHKSANMQIAFDFYQYFY